MLQTRLQFVADKGDEAWQQFLDALSPESRDLSQKRILGNVWYPFTHLTEMSETIDRLFGKGDLELCRDLGRYSCDYNSNRIYRAFFKFLDVHFLIRRSAAAWSVHYDAGEMVIKSREDYRVTLAIRDLPDPQHSHCLNVMGWIERAGELSGCKNIRHCINKCREHGKNECEWTFEWE